MTTPTDPVSATLDAQRRYLELAEETVEKSQLAPDRLERMQEVEVGQTPSEVVYRENKLELLHYEAQTDEQHDVPILVVYALINKPYILDLQPDRSVVRRLLEAGHDVYLIDWNEPSRLDQHLTLADYVERYIDNCVDVVAERSDQEAIDVLGYCMGGTLSAVYAALYPERVNALGLMAAGLCFDDTAGTLELWGDEEHYDPREITRTFGNMPGEFLDVGFALMDPVDNYVSKYVRLYDNLEDQDFVENFGRMEQWLSEGIDVAGEAYAEFLEHFYQGDELVANEFHLDGKHVDVTEIDMPVLQILGEYDHLVPAAASKPFNDVVGSDDVTTIEYPTGHIGLSVSGSSHEDVWPRVAEWYADRMPEAGADRAAAEEAAAAGDARTEATPAGDGEASAAEEGAVAAEEAAVGGTEPAADATGEAGDALETVDGIGPTYAERLREAGIESRADLADADPDEVAGVTGAPAVRVEDWLDQARPTE